jgi:hypothetical protein
MNQNCQHCGELIVGDVYRVTSEDQGITLLDLVVCALCSMEAKRLRLHTEEINVRSKQVSARSRVSHRRHSTFKFNKGSFTDGSPLLLKALSFVLTVSFSPSFFTEVAEA